MGTLVLVPLLNTRRVLVAGRGGSFHHSLLQASEDSDACWRVNEQENPEQKRRSSNSLASVSAAAPRPQPSRELGCELPHGS